MPDGLHVQVKKQFVTIPPNYMKGTFSPRYPDTGESGEAYDKEVFTIDEER